MLPADLNDEQRAHFAHEHPTDLDSGPSSPSSAAHASTSTFYNSSRRRSKSASHNRSNASADGSPSSHLLARLVASEEEVREINATLIVTSERLEAESSRANAAERRALDYFHRLRIATENRERAEQESARLREELKLYKLQLENAQKEIFRAQDIIDQVAAQRNEAEAEAARSRTKARKLQEEKLVMLAREEGRMMGYREGLSMGRRIGYDEENFDGDDNGEDLTDDERNDPRARVQLRSSASIRQPPMRAESAPPVRTFETALHAPLPIPSHINPDRSRTPSHENPPFCLRITSIPQPRHGSQDLIPVPRTFLYHPRTNRDMPVPSSPGSVATEIQDNRHIREPEPTPIPPPIRSRDYAYQSSVPAPIQHPRTASITSHTSTHLSQYDLVNKRPGSSLRNEIYLGRAGSGTQPSRPSTRNEHRDDESRHSSRTEAESIVEQWRADSDTATPPRNPPRSFTPSSASHPRRPPNFYYRPREIVTPTPLGDVGEDPVPTESTATQPRPLPSEDSGSQTAARSRSPLEYLRKRFRQRSSSSSTGVPDIVGRTTGKSVPSEPETSHSPSATITAQPELLSPDTANRPLPQDDSQSQPQVIITTHHLHTNMLGHPLHPGQPGSFPIHRSKVPTGIEIKTGIATATANERETATAVATPIHPPTTVPTQTPAVPNPNPSPRSSPDARTRPRPHRRTPPRCTCTPHPHPHPQALPSGIHADADTERVEFTREGGRRGRRDERYDRGRGNGGAVRSGTATTGCDVSRAAASSTNVASAAPRTR
ncbi:hypothetical protein JVU11DRAFT_152 [Chiua virens]|nr:hypothetical protein JVU11DRAFT_152 [Chiua virens]